MGLREREAMGLGLGWGVGGEGGKLRGGVEEKLEAVVGEAFPCSPSYSS